MPPDPSAADPRHRPTRLRDRSPGPLGRLAAIILSLALARFGVVGAMGLAFDTAIFRTFTLLDSPEAVARGLSVACATIVTWRFNRALTFGPSARSQTVESSRYGAVTLVAQGFNYTLFLALRLRFPDLHDLVALVLSSGAAAGLSFTGHRFFTFSGAVRTARTDRPLVVSELPR